MSVRDKAKKAGDAINEALGVEQELEGPVRGLAGAIRRWVKRIKARRARKAKP